MSQIFVKFPTLLSISTHQLYITLINLQCRLLLGSNTVDRYSRYTRSGKKFIVLLSSRYKISSHIRV